MALAYQDDASVQTLEGLAFIHDLGWQDLPQSVQSEIALALLDTLGRRRWLRR